MRYLSLVCWNCNKTFECTEWYYNKVIAEKIPDHEILCDCGPGPADVENAIKRFWAEVWQ